MVLTGQIDVEDLYLLRRDANGDRVEEDVNGILNRAIAIQRPEIIAPVPVVGNA
jgi:hypothetical protein